MEQNDKKMIQDAESRIRQLHPNWSQDKTRYVALQISGMIPTRR